MEGLREPASYRRNAGGFVVSYPDLPGYITCGETLERAVANAVDAKKAWLEAVLEDGIEIKQIYVTEIE